MVNINVEKILAKYADIILKQMKHVLIQENRRASGKFINSLGYKIGPRSIEFFGEEYGKYIQTGRRPGKQPPIEPIVAWLKVKKVSIGNGRLRPMVKRGRKAPSENQIRGQAYVISRAIGRRGTKGTDFMKIMKTEKEKILQEVKEYYIDLIYKSIGK